MRGGQFYIFLVILCCGFATAQQQCQLPAKYLKSLFSIEGGLETYTVIKPLYITSSHDSLNGTCSEIVATDTKFENANEDIQVLFKNRTNNCYFCYHFFYRSQNILQYRRTQCKTPVVNQAASSICLSLRGVELEVGFPLTREDSSDFNCKQIIEGVFHFTYALRDQTGVCNSPRSLIKACQRQGSPLRDNSIYTQKFGWCPSMVTDAEKLRLSLDMYTWRCLGRWVDVKGNIFGAIEFDSNDIKFKYRCITTRIDEQNTKMIQQWGMTVDAGCKDLRNFHYAPIQMVLAPAFDVETQAPEIQPGCKLPTNFTGQWFYPAEFNTKVTINSTHIYFLRRLDAYRWEEIYFVCRQSQESRYLMATVTKGKCDVDFMCFHFMPRHHNLIRFRMSRPFRLIEKMRQSHGANYMVRMFREACHWNSFTLNYLDWVYEYFILDPPVPVNCPIQGRYTFVQKGQQAELYYTKIPGGVTPRPRVQVLCSDGKNQSDLASCVDNPKQLRLDSERCMRLDFTGRPISEYDIADHLLTCVGYWMEDTKSYLITYDPQDPVTHHFRCWVYKRLSFHNYVLSRSQTGHCAKQQTAESATPEQGASLLLEMRENELEFDGCPMKWDDGRDPYANPSVLNVYGGSNHLAPALSTVSLLLATGLLAFVSLFVDKIQIL